MQNRNRNLRHTGPHFHDGEIAAVPLQVVNDEVKETNVLRFLRGVGHVHLLRRLQQEGVLHVHGRRQLKRKQYL